MQRPLTLLMTLWYSVLAVIKMNKMMESLYVFVRRHVLVAVVEL
jgi:hypothetical protein